MSVGRRLAALLLLAPLTVAACAVDAEDGASEDVEASADAIRGSIAPGAKLRTTARVNLREAPSKSATVITTMPLGAEVTAVAGAATSGYYKVAYAGDEGWAYGTYLAAADPDGEAEGATEEQAPAQGGETFNGRRFTGVTMLWQGDWSYLVRCDSYSRAKGRVVFFCDQSPSRSFVDDGAWIAVPRASFSSGLCGKSAKVCKNGSCIVAKVVEKSVTAGKWEGSRAVLEALGVDVGFSGCSSSFGTATGVSVTLQ